MCDRSGAQIAIVLNKSAFRDVADMRWRRLPDAASTQAAFKKRPAKRSYSDEIRIYWLSNRYLWIGALEQRVCQIRSRRGCL